MEKAIMPTLAKGVPLVIDPVMVASSGKVLMKKDAIRALRKFIAHANLVTPNRDEAALLWGKPCTVRTATGDDAEESIWFTGHPDGRSERHDAEPHC